MSEEQPLQRVEFKKVVIDCQSVGFAASELQPSGVTTSFRIRNILLCILSLMKMYLLAAFDCNVFCKFNKEEQNERLKLLAKIFTSPSTGGKEKLASLSKKVESFTHTTTDCVVEDVCKEIQKILLRQDVHFNYHSGVTCILLWDSLGLPPILLLSNKIGKDEAEAVRRLGNMLQRENKPLFKLLDKKFSEHPEIVQSEVLIISNSEDADAFDSDCVEAQIPFAITRDSAYFFIPKDPHGRNENTLMQDLLLSGIRLSDYEKAWTKYGRRNLSRLTQGEQEQMRIEIKNWRDNNASSNLPYKDMQAFHVLLVSNFVATSVGKSKPCEIIKFHLILLDLSSGEEIGCFDSLCKPQLNPRLSRFCRKQSGIRQEDVQIAPIFSDVLMNVETWLKEKGVPNKRFAIATDSGDDVGEFLR